MTETSSRYGAGTKPRDQEIGMFRLKLIETGVYVDLAGIVVESGRHQTDRMLL
jgi:hypothetical protein